MKKIYVAPLSLTITLETASNIADDFMGDGGDTGGMIKASGNAGGFKNGGDLMEIDKEEQPSP